MGRRLLILGGTAEAAALAYAVNDHAGAALEITTSLAGRLGPTTVVPGRVRVGGFGGVSAMASFLRHERIDAIIDATHPFAEGISHNAVIAAAHAGVPRLVLIRPPWRPGDQDTWEDLADLREAAERLPQISRRAFLAVGSGGLQPFEGLERVWLLVRLFERPVRPLPLNQYETIVARPPFSESGERALMHSHRIDTLVAKNSGGATEAKLAAARSLRLRVLLVRRPPPPPGPIVQTVEEALSWVSALDLGR